MQIYVEKGRLQAEFDNIVELVDAGDIIGVTGTMKRTDKVIEYFNKVSLSATFLFLYSCGLTSFQGELSVYVSSWVMLTKSLQPLPDKYHGLTDVSKRYRLRHLDMIVNPEVRNVFRARAKITSLIRQMLDSDSFLEV